MSSPKFYGALALGLTTLAASCGSTRRVLDPYADVFKPSVRTYFDTGNDEAGEVDLFVNGALAASVDILCISFPYLAHRGDVEATTDAAVQNEKAKLRLLEQRAQAAEATRDDKRAAREQLPAGATAPARQAAEAEHVQAESALALARIDLAAQQGLLATAQRQLDRSDGTRLDGDWTVGPRMSFGATNSAGDTSSSGAPVIYVGLGAFAQFKKGGSISTGDEGAGVELEAGYLWGVSADETVEDNDDGAIYVGFSIKL